MTRPSAPEDARTDIAIIGMSGRFPGARTLEDFWQNVRDGVESRTVFTDEDLAKEGLPRTRQRNHVRSGFVLDDIDRFDAAFFGINPREAETLDPQHRLFLECAWEALEDAAYDPDRFDGTVALYAGSTWCNYLVSNLFRSVKAIRSVGHRQLVYGSVPDYMVTRVAYKLNLTGPACFVQTACSTSLSAVHLAAQSLAKGECDLALAGGVSVKVPHRVGYVYEEGGMESPDGHIRTFDANAKGTVFGSGVGIVVLKRVEQARAERDHIYAVIRGTATNNDGSTKVGFTAPSVTGQAQVITKALEAAGVSADEIDYVEAHGTGTELGDPIEVAALVRAFSAHTSRQQYCAIGSVKPNVGHLDAAAGVGSLIKTVYALRHRQLPPTINFETLNPKIEIEGSPFFINTTLRNWPSAEGRPRRAGVSSFGFGGTNAHVIVEEAPTAEPPAPSPRHKLLLISARTPSGLDAACARLGEHLASDTRTDLADVAYTLQLGRKQFAVRRAVVCDSHAAARDALHDDGSRWVSNGRAEGRHRPVVFMFPGQGAQYVGMGRGLYDEEPVFRAAVDECAAGLLPHLGFDLREALYQGDDVEGGAERLKRTAVTQAAVFTIELALARLWMHWGITPSAMIGHSIGEYVAATVSGVLSLPDALRLVALRGQLMEAMPPGAMLAVPLPEERLASMLGDRTWLAAANAPSLCVASGSEDGIAALERRLADQGLEGRRLHTSHAFHSGLMDGALDAFVDAVRTVPLRAPEIPYVSNVTGDWATEALVTDPAYWGRHIREAVRFSDGARRLLEAAETVFLEVGPGTTLSGLIRQHTRPQDGRVAVAAMRHPHEDAHDRAVLLHALGRLWVSGVSVDWQRFSAHESRRRVPLPSYPFERTRHWVDADQPNVKRGRGTGVLMPQSDLGDWFYSPSWTRTVPPAPNGSAPDSWVVFVDESRVAAEVVARLGAGGRRVVTVRPGTSFQEDGTGFVIDPASPADYASLLHRLRRQTPPATAVAHLWGLGDEAPRANGFWHDRGFYSLLYLAQAFGEAGITSKLQLNVVTSGVQDVTGDEQLVPGKATALGAVRVIPQEFPNIACRAIDLSLGDDRPESVDRLVAELLTPPADTTVAYRRGRRWTQTYEPVHLSAPHGRPARLRDRGTYLITGGTGGIGLVLAGWLARSVRCNLVLTSRRGLPPRDQWDAVLAHTSGTDPVVRQILHVRELEAAGAQVLVAAADVADGNRMQAVVDQAIERFGAIHGVIHSAGIAGGGMIQLKKPEVAAAVLQPKVEGTEVLGGLFEERPLDFFVLCSSLTSVLGGVGQVDYCAANAFLDVWARWYAAKTGTFTVAVNWSAWQEIGMAVETDIPDSLKGTLRDQMLAAGLSNVEGIDAFQRILDGAADPQVAVSQLDVQKLLELMAHMNGGADGDSTSEPAAAPAGSARPELATGFVAPRTDTERRLCALWQESLGIADIGVNDSFFDLGGHSLLAVRMMTNINQALRTEIPVAKLYEGLTVAFLGRLIDGRDEASSAASGEQDARRRDKARRQKEHQQRRLAMARR